MGVSGLGFEGFGFRGWGFSGLGVGGFGVWGFRVLGRRTTQHDGNRMMMIMTDNYDDFWAFVGRSRLSRLSWRVLR